MNCSPPGSSVHGISQARILEWVDIPNFMFLVPSSQWKGASLVAQRLKHLPPMQETWVQSLGQESPGEGNGNPLQYVVGYSPQGRKESDMTEQLHFTSLHFSMETFF